MYIVYVRYVRMVVMFYFQFIFKSVYYNETLKWRRRKKNSVQIMSKSEYGRKGERRRRRRIIKRSSNSILVAHKTLAHTRTTVYNVQWKIHFKQNNTKNKINCMFRLFVPIPMTNIFIFLFVFSYNFLVVLVDLRFFLLVCHIYFVWKVFFFSKCRAYRIECIMYFYTYGYFSVLDWCSSILYACVYVCVCLTEAHRLYVYSLATNNIILCSVCKCCCTHMCSHMQINIHAQYIH